MCVVLEEPCGATDWESGDTGRAHLGHYLPDLRANFVTSLCLISSSVKWERGLDQSLHAEF